MVDNVLTLPVATKAEREEVLEQLETVRQSAERGEVRSLIMVVETKPSKGAPTGLLLRRTALVSRYETAGRLMAVAMDLANAVEGDYGE